MLPFNGVNGLRGLIWALRKNPERKNPESGKRNNPESENLECANPEWEKI